MLRIANDPRPESSRVWRGPASTRRCCLRLLGGRGSTGSRPRARTPCSSMSERSTFLTSPPAATRASSRRCGRWDCTLNCIASVLSRVSVRKLDTEVAVRPGRGQRGPPHPTHVGKQPMTATPYWWTCLPRDSMLLASSGASAGGWVQKNSPRWTSPPSALAAPTDASRTYRLTERNCCRASEKTLDEFKVCLSSISAQAKLNAPSRLAKTRRHAERDYWDMKLRLGFNRHDGCSWCGLHRHLRIVALLQAFIALHTEGFAPSRFGEAADLDQHPTGRSGSSSFDR